MLSPKTITGITFVAAYSLLIIGKPSKAIVMLAASVLLILTGVLSIGEAATAINWNVLGIFVGMLVMADLFIHSKVPAFLADILVTRVKRASAAMLSICALTSFISAFVENVATVLIIAPIAIAVAKRLKVTPVPFLIGIAISSNLQGTATLVGDPPSMLLGGFAKMTFNDFFVFEGKPSIFFAVQLGAIASFVVLYVLFKRFNQLVCEQELEKVQSWFPTILLIGLIVALALSSFFDPGFGYLAGILCMAGGLFGLVWNIFQNGHGHSIKLTRELDWETTIFLTGVFVVVGGLSETGLIEDFTNLVHDLTGDNVFLTYSVLVWVSVLFSAFVDNVPYIVALLPVAEGLALKIGVDPLLFYFGILIGTSLGGNITPIGASANIVAVGLVKRSGHNISFWEFVKIGLPFTIAAVSAGYIFTWFVWR